MKTKTITSKLLCYVSGLFIIAIGINISKLSGCGISPASSVPRVLEVIKGWTLGTTTIIIYCLLVLLQFIVLGKGFKTKNILGIAVAVLFGFLVNFTGTDRRAFGHLLADFPHPQSYAASLLYLVCSIIIIAIGVFLYLLPELVPMPAEGLAGAISKKSGLKFGDCKTIVDTSLIVIAIILQFVFLGGFDSFTTPPVVVREGTVLSAVCIGQIVKWLNRKYKGR